MAEESTDIVADVVHTDESSDCGNTDKTEDKLLYRKLRNRASAAISRDRKRKYVQHLENKVLELENVVNQLEVENTGLKAESHLLGSLYEGMGIMLDNSKLVELYSDP